MQEVAFYIKESGSDLAARCQTVEYLVQKVYKDPAHRVRKAKLMLEKARLDRLSPGGGLDLCLHSLRQAVTFLVSTIIAMIILVIIRP